MKFLALYVITCFLWSMYSLKMQKKIFPKTSLKTKSLVVILNFLLTPIAILFAIFRKEV